MHATATLSRVALRALGATEQEIEPALAYLRPHVVPDNPDDTEQMMRAAIRFVREPPTPEVFAEWTAAHPVPVSQQGLAGWMFGY